MKRESYGWKNMFNFSALWSVIKASVQPTKRETGAGRLFKRRKDRRPKINPDKGGHILRRKHFGLFSPVKPIIVNHRAVA